MIPAYAGLHVAFAKKKPLTIVVGTHDGHRFAPLLLRRMTARPPRGMGNAVIALDPPAIERFADETAAYFRLVEREHSVAIARIAIDAPRAPVRERIGRGGTGAGREALRDGAIATPTLADAERLRTRTAAAYLIDANAPRVRGAHMLWMLVGFALFRRLETEWPCIEAHPWRIASALTGDPHVDGVDTITALLDAASTRTGWPAEADPLALEPIASGRLDDRIDAYLCAWEASLAEAERVGGDGVWPRR